MPVTLRPANSTDAEYLLELEATCMRGYAEALWGNWRPSATLETFDTAGHEIIQVDGRAVGCIAVTLYPNHMFIDKLYIHPEFQGRGFGASVLRGKSDAAAAEGLRTKLSVLNTNPADKFYRREGFTLEAETTERRKFSKAVP
jgi:ribosomal protein S18 acetylase RimI-like enzyme